MRLCRWQGCRAWAAAGYDYCAPHAARRRREALRLTFLLVVLSGLIIFLGACADPVGVCGPVRPVGDGLAVQECDHRAPDCSSGHGPGYVCAGRP